MKNRLITLIILIALPSVALADEFILDLRGFQIGQYREVARREFGEPFQKDKYADGLEYEVYLVKPDTSVYMIFEYSPSDLEIVWSIQLTGKSYDTDFKKLSLGMDQGEVLKALGGPSNKVDVGTYGERWEFAGTNYSIEISKTGKLSSIKITDKSYEMFPKFDVNKIPTFDQVVKALQSKNNSKIKELLSPDLEMYLGDSIYFFRNNMSEEVKLDKSGIFQLTRKISRKLHKVDTKDINQYEENIRISQGHDPMHVIKLKMGQGIREIVLKYRFGKYLIWEIRA